MAVADVTRTTPAPGRVVTVTELRRVTAVWAIWLAAVVVLATFARQFLPVDSYHLGFDDRVPEGSLFRWWDYLWYEGIAETGYPEGAPAGRGGQRYGFFPLWPALLAAAGQVVPMWFVACVVSWLATFAAFVGVAFLNPDGNPVRTAVVFACLPGSYAMAMWYPDSTALAAAVWACVFARRDRWAAAVVLGLVAGFARPSGWMVVIPLLLLARNAGGGRGRYLPALAPVAAAGLTFLFFWVRTGTPSAFSWAQSQWNRRGPGSLVDSVEKLGTGEFPPRLLFDIGVAAFAVWLVVLAWQRGASWLPWAAYATAMIGLSLFSGSFFALGRHLCTTFPLTWVAAGEPALQRRWIVAVGVTLNVLMTLAMVRHFP